MRRRHGRFYERFPRMINPKVARRTETDAWAEDMGSQAMSQAAP